MRNCDKQLIRNRYVSDEDGRFRLNIHDDGPGFETRPFAASVLARERPPPEGLNAKARR